MYCERIFRELQKRRIKYLVVGGVAVNLHGFQRATGDLDIMLSLDVKNLMKFIGMAKELGLKPKVPVRIDDLADEELRLAWVEEKDMKVFTIYDPSRPIEHIDVMVDVPIDFETAYGRRDVIRAGDISISLISIADLIRMKKCAGRERDFLDMDALEKIRKYKG